MKQIVAHKKLSTLHGLALVLGILAMWDITRMEKTPMAL